MGVPAFFRWLTDKYPKVIQDVLEARVAVDPSSSTTAMPFDSTLPNPSGLECDNLYIDMNGIIHPCSHPEEGPQPQTEVEMYENVCRYVDRLFRAARPRKLLYLAIDGVAPRAKMNQQRARRFRSAQEAREKDEIEDKVKSQMKAQGFEFPEDEKKKSSAWDSNVITPGTPFMKNLSEYISFYIRKRMSEDKAWKSIKVIFSDASVPGEGEHKIMAHIRQQRAQPNYNPNLVHILHGLDADLIMLALATHEAHFYIMREEVVFGRRNAEFNENRKETCGFKSQQLQLDEEVGPIAMALPENRNKQLVRLSIPILREYLRSEFRSCENVPFQEVSFEHVIDDIVFLCFFVGNDFLPHLPSLDIRDGGLDFLFNIYKKVLPTLGSYITDHGGKVNLSNVDVILSEVGSIEDHVFNMRKEIEKRNQELREMRLESEKLKKAGKADDPALAAGGNVIESIPKVKGRSAKTLEAPTTKRKREIKPINTHQGDSFVALGRKNSTKEKSKNMRKQSVLDNAKAAKELKRKLNQKRNGDVEKNDVENATIENDNVKESVMIEDDDKTPATITEVDDDDEEKEFEMSDDEQTKEPVSEEKIKMLLKERVKVIEQAQLDKYAKNVEDKVRLHEKGWKDRYYTDKCKAENISGGGGREHLFRSYIKGLCWVMKYYYSGVPSWKWYFPFHYAPFASDLKNIERFQRDCEEMEQSTPFSPVEQLLSVLPEDSSHAVPKESRWLMKDEESPIIDFYPKEIKCDPNGKAMPWLWVVLLPFIDENRLLDALKPTRKKWTKYEQFCNSRGLDDGYIFVHQTSAFFSTIQKALTYPDETAKHRLPKSEFSGMVRPPLSNEKIEIHANVEPPIDHGRVSRDGLLDQPIYSNECLCAAFSEPRKLPHKSIILPNSILNPPVLDASDYRIRRPRFRGGPTIANLGGGHENRHGGGMHVDRNFRNNQSGDLPTGMREWGTLEPSTKRFRHGDSNGQHQKPYRANLFDSRNGKMNFDPRMNNDNGRRQQNFYGMPGPPQGFNRNHLTTNRSHNGVGIHTRFTNPPPHHSLPPPPMPGSYNHPPPPLPHQVQNQHSGGRTNFTRPPPSGRLNWTQPTPITRPSASMPNTNTASSSNFSFNRRNTGASFQSRNNPQKRENKSNVNPQLMQTLRSQLASTLKQNRQSGKRN